MVVRQLVKRIQELSGKYPIVTLTGPRQSGKSTLLKTAFPDYRYISMEDPDMRLLVEKEPRAFLIQYDDKVIIDEAQRTPQLFSYLQTHTDTIDKPGMYLLAGSQNFLLMEQISQSLAGRTAVLKLLPFSMTELKQSNLMTTNPDEWILNGAYPRLYKESISPHDFYPHYIQTYIERDLRLMRNVHDLSVFVRFVKLCAGRIGQLVNVSSLANDCGINQLTVQNWLSILEASYILFLLKPHHANYNKRLAKMPKLYFYDTGLASYLLGIETTLQLSTHYFRGNLFENMVILEYLKNRYNTAREPSCFFWRDKLGHEVDLLLEKGLDYKAIEIKSGSTYATDYFKGLDYWGKLSKSPNENRYVVFAEEEKMKFSNGNLTTWNDLDSVFE